jgi:large subunit ribosomal protein L6
MSRIGKQLITVPQNVQISIENRKIVVKGPKGELDYTYLPEIKVEYNDNIIKITPLEDSKKANSLWGLTRTLINNMIIGVTEEFKKELTIIGVGYKAELQGSKVILSLGFSHKIEYEIPKGIRIEYRKEKNDILSIFGIDKQLVGEVAAKIRSYKKPEPYKGKGIRYTDEYVARKEGKTSAK